MRHGYLHVYGTRVMASVTTVLWIIEQVQVASILLGTVFDGFEIAEEAARLGADELEIGR
jgi:hypothetical protein